MQLQLIDFLSKQDMFAEKQKLEMFSIPQCLGTVTGWTRHLHEQPSWRNEVMFQCFLLLSSLIHRLPYHRCSGRYLFSYSTYTMSAWINLWLSQFNTVRNIWDSTQLNNIYNKGPVIFRLLPQNSYIFYLLLFYI